LIDTERRDCQNRPLGGSPGRLADPSKCGGRYTVDVDADAAKHVSVARLCRRINDNHTRGVEVASVEVADRDVDQLAATMATCSPRDWLWHAGLWGRVESGRVRCA